MKRPERIPSGLLNHSHIDDFFKRFFNRCAGSTEITDEEFSVLAHECFNEILRTHYGTEGFNYILEHQDKFHDS